MIITRVGLLALLVCAAQATIGLAQDRPSSVLYKETVYLSIDKLAERLGAAVSLSPLARDVKIKTKDKEWEFADGGLRLKLPTGKERTLKRPLLILEGKHFFPLAECSPTLWLFRGEPWGVDPPASPVVITIGGKDVAASAQPDRFGPSSAQGGGSSKRSTNT